MVVQIVRFASALDYDGVLEVARERAPEFEKLPGLVQKYYTRTADGTRVAGIYVWDSEDSMKAFRASELAQGIPAAYKIVGTPDIEFYNVAFSLRQ